MENPITIDLAKILLSDLLEDREASLQDIQNCKYALSQGVLFYGGDMHNEKSVQERLEANQKIVKVIDAELKRRNVQIVTTNPARSGGGNR